MLKRPDRTDRIARAVRAHLQPGERVLAGVAVQRPGTTYAGLQGGAAAATGAATDSGVRFAPGDPDPGLARHGVRRGVHFHLVLTDRRLLLVRRSIFGRSKEVVLDLPLAAVAGIDVPRQASSLVVRRHDAPDLRLELPQAHRFLPDVYRELPERLARARG